MSYALAALSGAAFMAFVNMEGEARAGALAFAAATGLAGAICAFNGI